MLVVRKQMGGHDEYNYFRSAIELLEVSDGSEQVPSAVKTMDVALSSEVGLRKVCFSYRSTDIERVREAKLGLEGCGFQVAWGLDVDTMSTQDWRTQWIHMCNDADLVVNFLSVDYVQSQACIDEWNYASKKKSGSSVLNLMLGGRQSREAIMKLADARKLDGLKGSGALVMHFTSDGQALSVYPDDDIVGKIAANLPGGGSAGETKSNSTTAGSEVEAAEVAAREKEQEEREKRLLKTFKEEERSKREAAAKTEAAAKAAGAAKAEAEAKAEAAAKLAAVVREKEEREERLRQEAVERSKKEAEEARAAKRLAKAKEQEEREERLRQEVVERSRREAEKARAAKAEAASKVSLIDLP